MRFMLDENIAYPVLKLLQANHHECEYIRELIPVGSVDQLVAFVAEDRSAVLVSHDGDFEKISSRIPDGQKTRFRKLSRIRLKCNEFQSAIRIEASLDFIRAEFDLAQLRRDKRMILTIGTSFIRSDR